VNEEFILIYRSGTSYTVNTWKTIYWVLFKMILKVGGARGSLVVK
jgi:hypothetical protein